MHTHPNTQKRFIAANILLPAETSNDTLTLFKQKLEKSIELGFTHVWINPIMEVKRHTFKHICLDTGILTEHSYSPYAPHDPQNTRNDFTPKQFKEKLGETRGKIKILVDFVWKHAATTSQIFTNHPDWKGTEQKDISDYKFTDKNGNPSSPSIINGIVSHLKKVIDLYLDPVNGFGFDGLRVDAASKFSPVAREQLYAYIRKQYPNAIIFEEVLFDDKDEDDIKKLANAAHNNTTLYSDFVTSNLYYQSGDAHGSLPKPKDMGDSHKLALSNNNGIGFTGNHDHYSAGWSIILSMAADQFLEKYKADKQYKDMVDKITIGFLQNDTVVPETILNTISSISFEHHSNKRTLVESHGKPAEKASIRYLLPFANEIARILLDPLHEKHETLVESFRMKLFEQMINHTLPSMSGYFMLYSEFTTAFVSQRIFATAQHHKTMPQLYLTVDDLKKDPKLTQSLIELIKKDLTTDSKVKAPNKHQKGTVNAAKAKQLKAKASSTPKYDGVGFYEKIVPISDLLAGDNGKKSNTKSSSNKHNADAEHKIEQNLGFWLPCIIDYLRQHPEENKFSFYADKDQFDKNMEQLVEECGIPEMVQAINEIFANLTTMQCRNYETFQTKDNYKIIIRHGENSTDVIVLNLNKDSRLTFDDIDLQKIAVLHQIRLFPPSKEQMPDEPFGAPMDKNAPLIHSKDGYLNNKGADCHDSYTMVTGDKAGHHTYLHLGPNMKCNITPKPNLKVATHVKTKAQRDEEVLLNINQINIESLVREKNTSVASVASVASSASNASTSDIKTVDNNQPDQLYTRTVTLLFKDTNSTLPLSTSSSPSDTRPPSPMSCNHHEQDN